MCFRYIPSGDANTRKLRGGGVFDADQAAWRRSGQGPCQIISMGGSEGAVAIRPCEVWFVLMPGFLEMAQLIEDRPFHLCVVDYHADVLNLTPHADHSPRSKEAGATVPPESWQWWYAPERQEAMTRSLTAADIITTPFPEYIPALKQFTNRVVHLPDVVSRRNTRLFSKGWKNVTAAVQEAGNERRNPS